jgi:hypothetical protein
LPDSLFGGGDGDFAAPNNPPDGCDGAAADAPDELPFDEGLGVVEVAVEDDVLPNENPEPEEG